MVNNQQNKNKQQNNQKSTASTIYLIIQIFIYFIIIVASWIFFHYCVLPILKQTVIYARLFRYFTHKLPDLPVFREGYLGASVTYTVVFEISKVLFHYLCIFLLIVYLVYLFIKFYVPETILLIPVRQPLLEMTPFAEFVKSGMFPFFDKLSYIITSNMPFGNKLNDLFKSTGEYFKQSFHDIATNSMKLQEPVESTTAQPTYNKNFTKKENESVENDFNKCMRSIIHLSSNASLSDTLLAKMNNNKTTIMCNIEKLQHYYKIKTGI